MERNLDFLATPTRGIPERHRSMRAVFDHSWNLLSEDERCVLHQLSIFRSGFQREAAEQVTGASLALLSALMDKSLLKRNPAGRYEVHELLRQYAEAKQAERPGELEIARQRHSAYYAEVIQRLQHELISVHQAEAVAETSVEMDNIRAAWQYAVEHEQTLVLHRFIRGLWHFYEVRGWSKEGEATYRWAMENVKSRAGNSDDVEPADLVLHEFLRAHYTWFSMRLGHWGEAGRLTQESATRLRSLQAWPELAAVLHMAGVALWATGKYPEARALLEEKLALERQLESPWDMAMGYGQLGLVYQGMGDYQKARELMRTAHNLVEACGDKRMTGVALYHRSSVEFDLEEFDSAREMLERSLEISAAVDDRWIMGSSRLQLGLVAQAQGDYEKAIHWLREAQQFWEETGDRWNNTRTLNGLGACLLALGDDDGAVRAFHEALAASVEAELLPAALESLVGLAAWQMKRGALEAALVTLEQVARHPACSQHTCEQASRLRKELEGQLKMRQLEDAQERFRAQTFDVFVNEILSAS
jgi:tetratricopeptide (TPR) repeat protein